MEEKSYLQVDPGGESYFYGTHLISGCVPRFIVSLTVPIDEDTLRQTMRDILKRFPQMAVAITRDENAKKYSLKDNRAEFPIFHDDGSKVVNMATKETNDYLFKVSYFDKKLIFDFLHVLGDGTGFIIFIKAVIYRYLELRHLPLDNDGTILTVDQEYDQQEGSNAIETILNEKASLPEWYNGTGSFQVPGISTEGDPSDTVAQIRIPFSKLYGVVKSYQSSPVTFLEPLFSHSIYEKYKDIIGDLPIVASIPVNMRPFYPNKTLRYFIAVAVLAHSSLFLKEDFENMLLTQKKLLDEQTKPEFLAYMAQSQARGMKSLIDIDIPIEQKVDIMSKSIISSLKAYSYIITNMGNIKLPEPMNQYVTEFYPILPTAICPYTIALTTWNNELMLSISQRQEDISVCERFVELLNCLNIPAYISEVFKNHTMRYFPS